jgi:hypothetical protein
MSLLSQYSLLLVTMRRSLVLKLTVLINLATVGVAEMAIGQAAGASENAGSSRLGILPPRNPAASLSPNVPAGRRR